MSPPNALLLLILFFQALSLKASDIPSKASCRAMFGPPKPELDRTDEDDPSPAKEPASFERFRSQLIGETPPIDPLRSLRSAYQTNQAVPAVEFFKLHEEFINHRSCNCKPPRVEAFLTKLAFKTQQWISRIYGSSISKDAWFKRLMVNKFRKAHGDPDATNQVIAHERQSFLRALENSLTLEVELADTYHQLARLIISSSQASQKSRLVREIELSNRYSARMAEIESKLRTLRLKGTTVDSQSELNLSLEHSSLSQKLDSINRRLNRSFRGVAIKKLNEQEKLLLSLWHSYQTLEIRAQQSLAELFVVMSRIRALENILEADLNGIVGPINESSLLALEKKLLSFRPYLEETFEYDDHGVSHLNPELSPSQRYYNALGLAKTWLQKWHLRIEKAAAFKDFRFTVYHLMDALSEIGMQLTLEARAKAVKSWFSHGKEKLASILKFKPSPQDRKVTKDLSKKRDQFLMNFEVLTKHVSGESVLGEIELKQILADLSNYFIFSQPTGSPVESVIQERLASPDGAMILNWMYGNSETAGYRDTPFSQILAVQIWQAHLPRLQYHEVLRTHLVRNLTVTAATAYALYDLFIKNMPPLP